MIVVGCWGVTATRQMSISLSPDDTFTTAYETEEGAEYMDS